MGAFKDADIFGDVKAEGPAFKDADIFTAPPAPKLEAEAPKEKPTLGERLTERLKANPLMITPWGMAAEGLNLANEAVEKVAYEAGGAATDATGSPTAGYLTNVGIQAIPVALGAKGTQTAVAPAMESLGRRLMQVALKPTWEANRTGKAARAIDTLLTEGVNPTEAGVNTLRSKIDDLNEAIKSKISSSDGTVYVGDVDKTLLKKLDEFKKQVNPNADMEAIRKAWGEFRSHPAISGNPNIPVQTAQELKQGTYRALGSKPYGEQQGAATEAQKTLARGLKEGINKAVPEVADLNKKESALLNAAELAERRAMMSANNQFGGIAWLNPLMLPIMIAERSPFWGGLMARGAYQGRNMIPFLGGGIGGAYLGAGSGAAPGASPMLDLTGDGALYAEYSPPSRGNPTGKTSSGTR